MTGIGHFLLLAAVATATAADSTNEISLLPAAAALPKKGMCAWTFVGRVLREVTPAESLPILDQFETSARYIVDQLDKTQNYRYNKTEGVIEQLMPKNTTSTTRETGEIFQDWLAGLLDVAYEWSRNNESESYQALATEFKAGRDWLRGLSQFDGRFTEQHVQVIGDFYRAYSARPEWGNKSPASMYEAFKTHVALKAAEEAGSSALPARVRREAMLDTFDDETFRGIYSKPRTETGFWGWLYTFMDYYEDAVVTYNRAQLTLWQPKMLVSFIAPPIKFIWTGVDIAYCLHEELYELTFAQETEERWWDVLLCGMEILGIIPGGGALKFGLRILIRMVKFKLGIHTVPWYMSGPWQYISSWWNGGGAEVATTTLAALIQATTTTTTTTPTPTKATPEYHFGNTVGTTKAPFIIGSMSG